MCAWDMQGFVEIYRGRENRHRQKNLAHATEYEFRLKASPSSTLRILIAQNSLKLSRGAYPYYRAQYSHPTMRRADDRS